MYTSSPSPLPRFLRSIRNMCIDFDCDCVFEIIMKCGDYLFRFLGPCLALVGLSLINFISYSFVSAFLFAQTGYTFLILAIMSAWIYFNIHYNYLRTMFRDAGRPMEYAVATKKLKARKSREEDDELDLDMDLAYTNEHSIMNKAKIKQCHKCKLCKPERAHHCSVCNRCVLKMDHHCPWVNNCVGWNNYRNFCLFMFYTYVGCMFVVYNCFAEFKLTYYHQLQLSTFNHHDRTSIVLIFQLCGAVMFSLSILGGFHLFLVLTNQTTIEFQINWSRRSEARRNGDVYRNPYDIGRTRNFQSIFGPVGFWTFRWLLPIEPSLHDGTSWPSLFKMDV